MCCCTVPTCCCGCTSMKTGLLIYAFLDALVQILFGVLLVLLKVPFLGAAPFIMAIIDIFLAIGKRFHFKGKHDDNENYRYIYFHII